MHQVVMIVARIQMHHDAAYESWLTAAEVLMQQAVGAQNMPPLAAV